MIQRILQIFIDGGPFIMSLIFISSMIALVIIIERYIYLGKITKNDDKILKRITDAIGRKNYEEALLICDTNPGPASNLIKAGIENRNKDQQKIEESIKDAAVLEIPKLERNLTTLGTIANISTLLGLLGTVLGNMEAFGLIGSNSAIGNMEVLASGISKALMTTAFGLIVAIPATIFYNHFVSKVNNMILLLEVQANSLVNIISINKKQV